MIAVDHDIKIYNMDDMMWALTTRVDAANGMQIVAKGGAGQAFQPSDRSSAGDKDWTTTNIRFGGGLAVDATIPFVYKDAFERPPYPVRRVDPSQWFSKEEIEIAQKSMTDYGRFLARTGF